MSSADMTLVSFMLMGSPLLVAFRAVAPATGFVYRAITSWFMFGNLCISFLGDGLLELSDPSVSVLPPCEYA